MHNEDRDSLDLARNLPPGIALSWGLVKEPQRGPKRELNIRQIVEAAIEIADRDGIASVTMQRVANSLGFTAMSLYRYIPSKNDLLILMQDAVCEILIPPEKDVSNWREDMRDYVHACIRVFDDHPWFVDIPVTGIPLTPNNMRAIDWALRTMRHFPISEYEKMSFVLLLSSYARSWGFVRRDMMRAIQAGSSPEAFTGLDYSTVMKQLVKPEQFPHLFPIVASGTYTGEHDKENEMNYGNDLDFGLERILDGIEHYIVAKMSKMS